MRPETPNHALQRTRPAVTPAASCLRLSPTAQRSRQPGESLSLGSLGVATRIVRTKPIITFLAAILILGASCRADVTFDDLFHIPLPGAERSLGAERLKVLQAALEDFNAALNFKAPVHAAPDKDAAVPADGGTSYYKARGYRITIMKSLFSMGDGQQTVHGYMYGPVLTLGPQLGVGNSDSISRVSFYPIATLNKLLK